jgi:hypothetical protein
MVQTSITSTFGVDEMPHAVSTEGLFGNRWIGHRGAKIAGYSFALVASQWIRDAHHRTGVECAKYLLR